ncbi:MAG: DUF2231 domain-containing protein [Angustibacter sp.]
MFDTINGLPVHALVVHAVVVLLPLAALGTLALAVRPVWRERYGLLLLGITAAATVLVPVASSSGEELAKRVGDPGRHADLGDQLLWFALPLLVLVAALVLLPRGRSAGHGAITVVAVLAAAAAVATMVQVYRVGDSGAEAVWGDIVTSTQR